MVMLNKNNLFVHKVMVKMVGRKICSMGGNKMKEEEGRGRWTKKKSRNTKRDGQQTV